MRPCRSHNTNWPRIGGTDRVSPRFSESYFRLVHLSNLISHRFLLPTLYDRRYHWEGKIDGHQKEDGIDADIVLS